MLTCTKIRIWRLEMFLAFLLHFWNGVISRTKPRNGLAVFISNKLGKIPFNGVQQKSPLFGLKSQSSVMYLPR